MRSLDELIPMFKAGKVQQVKDICIKIENAFSESDRYWNIRGACYLKTGETSEALKLFFKSLTLNAGNIDSIKNISLIYLLNKDFLKRKEFLEVLIDKNIEHDIVRHQLLETYLILGSSHRALMLAKSIISETPDDVSTWNYLIQACLEEDELIECETAIKIVEKIDPNNPDFLTQKILFHLKRDEIREAVDTCQILENSGVSDEKISSIKAWIDSRCGKIDRAMQRYEEILSRFGDHFSALSNLLTLAIENKMYAYIVSLERRLPFKIDNRRSLIAVGTAAYQTNELKTAIHYFERASLEYGCRQARINLAKVYLHLGDFQIASQMLSLYDFDEKHQAEAYAIHLQCNLGLNNHEQARIFCRKLEDLYLKVSFDYSVIADYYYLCGKYETAVSWYETAFDETQPVGSQLAYFIDAKRRLADWNVLDLPSERIDNPLISLTQIDDPFVQKQKAGQRTMLLAETFDDVKPHVQIVRKSPPKSRIKVGFIGSDFYQHATMVLLSGLLRLVKRSLDVCVINYGLKFDQTICGEIPWVDISSATVDAAVASIKKLNLDVAIDLKGFTRGNRLSLFARRVAPIQISFLGYPGTLGAPFIDYLIADKVLIPEEFRQCYPENIIYMPNSYQPNDNTRAIPLDDTLREDHGLPSEGFVFCCFNALQKITPREFDIWMRILLKVPGSVLWLMDCHEMARENLGREAETRGVDRERIIFARRLDHGAHLARHRHADLFLDTFCYNAHTTASDSLWAGLPIVTKIGNQFAARVGASLLTAIGLPELIAHSEEEYEQLILQLATQPEKLHVIRRTLHHNRDIYPLFDTETYTRDLERALKICVQREDSGDIIVPTSL